MQETCCKLHSTQKIVVKLFQQLATENTDQVPATQPCTVVQGSLVAQLVGCWTHNPRVVGSIPGDADCFIWDNIPGQDVNLDCASLHPGVMGTWLLVGS